MSALLRHLPPPDRSSRYGRGDYCIACPGVLVRIDEKSFLGCDNALLTALKHIVCPRCLHHAHLFYPVCALPHTDARRSSYLERTGIFHQHVPSRRGRSVFNGTPLFASKHNLRRWLRRMFTDHELLSYDIWSRASKRAH